MLLLHFLRELSQDDAMDKDDAIRLLKSLILIEKLIMVEKRCMRAWNCEDASLSCPVIIQKLIMGDETSLTDLTSRGRLRHVMKTTQKKFAVRFSRITPEERADDLRKLFQAVETMELIVDLYETIHEGLRIMAASRKYFDGLEERRLEAVAEIAQEERRLAKKQRCS